MAKLRCCASCKWIFSSGIECPKCQFGSYGAYYVFGKKAYRFAKTQAPWKELKMQEFEHKLDQEIAKSKPKTNSERDPVGFLYRLKDSATSKPVL